MNIYIGNISFDSTEDDVKEAFAKHGEVASVKLITDNATGRSKGFGFIEMPKDDEAEAAIAALNGTDLGGREIKVNKARPREERT